MKEMLACVDSLELAEWMAYERVSGPLGSNYVDEALAAIHEQLQVSNKLLGAKLKANPIGDPKHYPRPHEVAVEAEKRALKEED